MKKYLFYLFLPLYSLVLPLQAQSFLAPGDPAPLFSAMADDGSNWALEDHLGRKNLVLYFYPAAMTGGCTAQACAYRDFQEELEKVDALIVGISGDEVEGLKLFKKAHDLNFTLLSDPNGNIAELFGVPTRAGGSLSRELDGEFHELIRGVTTARWTFIIGRDGRIIYKNKEVNPEKDTEEVLNFLKNQNSTS